MSCVHDGYDSEEIHSPSVMEEPDHAYSAYINRNHKQHGHRQSDLPQSAGSSSSSHNSVHDSLHSMEMRKGKHSSKPAPVQQGLVRQELVQPELLRTELLRSDSHEVDQSLQTQTSFPDSCLEDHQG